MSASLVDRLIIRGDGENSAIDLAQFRAAIELFDAGVENAAFITTTFDMDTAQGDELDEILGTRPGILAPPLERAQWSSRVMGILNAGATPYMTGWSGYGTSSAVRVKLGLSA